jgi:iron complex transport system substrate-binding protein
MNIVSLLPSATEIVAELGLLDCLVGISHECDYPPEVNSLPRVLTCPIYNVGLSSAEIDRRVTESVAAGKSLYEIDVPLLGRLQPDLVLSQMLCDVCAIGYGTVAGALATLEKRAKLLNLEPRCLDDLYANIREVAEATDTLRRAEVLINALKYRVDEVGKRVKQRKSTPRVLFLEWIDPLYGAGHWTPEFIDIAGGVCISGVAGTMSVPLVWDDIVAQRPDIIIIACCGYSVERTKEDLSYLQALPGWSELAPVLDDQVYLIDGSHYFNRSGPRLVDSLEMIAATLHPECFPGVNTSSTVFKMDHSGGASAQS